MKKTKAALSIAIMLAFCMTFLTPTYAATATTTQEKAEALSKLSLISGTNGNYNLTGTLKRWEAAVMIVRLLGRTSEVTAVEKNYKVTGFTDVASTTWYAPYIGYCVQAGYMAQIDNNLFKPDNTFSEKSFFTLILRSLGYKDGTDFSWSNVYQKAMTFGLTTDPSYSTKTADKANFTRGDMVTLLFGIMNTKFKGSDNTVLDNLIGSGAVTKEVAKAAGFIMDKLPTAVTAVKATAFNKISVTLNEYIPSLTSEQIIIYDTLDKTKRLTSTLDSLNGTELTLTTGVQIPDRGYTIEINSVKDGEENVVELIRSTFTGYKAGASTNDFFFHIQKVESINKNSLNVYFTHPVNTNAEIPLYYEIFDGEKSFVKGSYQNMSIKCTGGVDNAVTISLQGYEMTKDGVYIIKISGDFCSAYGAVLNEGKGEEAVFSGSGTEDPSFNVNSVRVTGPNSLEIEFNRYIDSFYGKQFLNYTVTGPNNASVIVNKAVITSGGDKAGKIVQLTTQTQFDKAKQYNLNINFLPDLLKKENLSDKNISFSGTYDTPTELKIIDCAAFDNQTLIITFDRQLDVSTVLNTGYYSVSGGTGVNYYATPVKVRYEETGSISRVRLYLPADKPLEAGKQYRTRISRLVQGLTGIQSPVDREIGVQGSSDKITKPIISEIAVVSKDTMRIRFNRDIAAELPNILASNYSLEYKQDGVTVKKVPSIVGYVNETTLILKFDKIDTGITYKLSFNTMKDYAGTAVRTAADGQNFIEFEYVAKK